MRAARAAADVVAEAVEFLERLDGDDPVDRRHAFRTLRELDQELLSDGAVIALLSHGDEIARGKSDAVVLAELESRLEAALIARERDTQVGRVAHRGLRLAQLRALVRVIDADAPVDDAGALRERRMRVVRALLPRARLDASPLRRAVWAALTRAFDALLRDEQLELSDLLAGWTTAMDPDDELVVAREASMVPEVRAVLDAYAAAMQATARAADPDDHRAAIAAIAAAGELTGALGATSSPRTDALRASLARLVRALDGVVRARGQRDVPGFLFDELEGACAVLADLVVGARRRLGLPVTAPTSPAAIRGVGLTLERLRRGGEVDLAGDAAVAAVAAGDDQIPLVARLLGVALARLTQLPVEAPPAVATPSEELVAARATLTDHGLPSWLPASRSIGGFHVVRPLGKGAGGSVFVACRAEERHDPAAEQVALKVPDYDGGAARNLSAQEFEAMFREEAGALLSLPRHANLAGFVTFDAGAKPKPILVMELVPGRTLEQVLEVGGLDMRGALRLIDGIAGGLETMHAARVAHLDLKPANVILRGEDTGALAPVLVDFGLAGRRVRPGCGSPHYGAPEVWSGRNGAEPFAADVYAFACLTFEILTGQVLVAGDTLKHVLATHVGGGAALLAQETLGPTPVAELLTAALARRADQRPSIARLRAGINAVAPDMVRTAWPLGA
ncbi:MAG: protein kinase [Kofleriaceae bacterium]|nr:protein kinase [Kofleriaceae bacterium]